MDMGNTDIEVEHRHSIEEALERLKDFPAGKKIIVWTIGEKRGMLEDIPIIVVRNEDLDVTSPNSPKFCESI